MNHMLCANGSPSARLRLQTQTQVYLGTAHSDTVCPLHLCLYSWEDWGYCYMGSVEEAERHIGKAAGHASRDVRSTSRFARRLDCGQIKVCQDVKDEEGREEEDNCSWVLCTPTCSLLARSVCSADERGIAGEARQ